MNTDYLVRLKTLDKAVIDKLESVNWDFGNRKIVDKDTMFPFNNRKYHTYPATYIPEIPYTLIEILSIEGDVVMDPFGGIGTTLVQALIQNRVPISIDNNFIASKIAKDFFTLFSPFVDLDKCMQSVNQILNDYDSARDYLSLLANQRKELQGWYEQNTLNELAFIILKYDQINTLSSEEGLKALYHLCLSNILTTVCSQNGGWAYIADNVKPKEECLKDKHTIEKFKGNILGCVRGVQEHKELLGGKVTNIYEDKRVENVINADILQLDLDYLKGTVNLVVTSPPYPKMIDYVKSQRLSYYIENRTFVDELHREIGARYRRNNKGNVEKYVIDMKICNKKIYESLAIGGYLCYVLPEFPKETDRREAIEEVINDCFCLGFKEQYRTNRCIPGTQRSNNIKWASLKKEQIIILEKSG